MKINYKKIWPHIGITGVIVLILWGNLIYMNLRAADPILPGWEEYDAERFNELMARGEPVLVETYASWCPTCLLQHKALETLHENGDAPTMRAIRVDYDRDSEFITKHGFSSTGMMVIFQQGRQITRASGLVTADQIDAFLNSTAATSSR